MSQRKSKGKVRFFDDNSEPGSSRTPIGSTTMCEPMPGSSNSGENNSMDPDTARRLFEVGANMFLLDVPHNTEVGIDLNSWNTGPNFKGIKMIPPGVHFIYWSAVSKEGQVAPRSGFFHDFRPKEILVKRYNEANENFDDIIDPEEINRLKFNLKDLDRNLGAYPYGSWKKWVSLTNKISPATVKRLEPTSGMIQSVTQLIPEEHKSYSWASGKRNDPMCNSATSQPREYLLKTTECETNDIAVLSDGIAKRSLTEEDKENDKLPKMKCMPSMQIRYTTIPPQYPSESTPAEITKHSMDSTYQLDQYLDIFKRLYGDVVSSTMSDRNQFEEVLGEVQFSFICFLVGQNYDSFEQWKLLLKMFCTSDEALAKHTNLYMTLINDLHFQIREVPEDFFVDIISSNNFLVSLLSTLFTLVRDNSEIDTNLKSRMDKFKTNLSLKFKWDFSEIDDGEELDEEDKPVIVDM